jgi:thioredoxin-dependent peroxiredoxin
MMAQVTEGMMAPDFTLPANAGGDVSLSSFRGQKVVVLYFYPKDMTSGCTKEACAFRDLNGEFEDAGAVILGVSRDSLASHGKFTAAHNLNFTLLSDPDAAVATAYGVYKERSMYGKKSMGIERTTFVIDRDGVVRKVYPKVKVDQHADAVLEFARGLAR